MPTLLDNGFVIATLTATGGSGKSYITTHDLALNRLVRFNFGLVTNLPLRVDKIAEFVANERGCKPEEVADRIKIIPEETLRRWANGIGGPWELTELYAERPCDLIIDEAHVYCKPKSQDQEWQAFLGEARHPPYSLQRVMFLSQSIDKIAKPITTHSVLRYRLEKGDQRRGFLGVSMGDLYQVIASLTGRLTPMVYRIEQTKDASEKWKDNAEDVFVFRADVQELYDTHSEAGGSSTATEFKAPPAEFERRPRLLPAKRDYYGEDRHVWTLPTWLWFFTRNMAPVAKVLGVVALFIFFTSGGLASVVTYAGDQFKSIAHNNIGGLHDETKSHASGATPGATDEPAGDEPCGCGRAKEERDELAERLNELLAEIHHSGAVGAISPRFVQFRGGVITDLHGVITDGRYEGQTVETIDFDNRRVLLSDAGWLRIDKAGADETAADIQRALPSVEASGGATGADNAAGAERVSVAGHEGSATR